ncbi:hypothetical protein DPMN_028858 [Dreissena polymorpha]|uniref:Uncharacterized protein n=1 Tax=Dreissena polymorpha TaxID=45954 RepID=A0A9D4REY0_DREPO|nr:hypothetical protein DPMN_028858 [Dreissena polymorpha]
MKKRTFFSGHIKLNKFACLFQVTVHFKVVSLPETHSEVNTQYGKKDIYSARVADSSDHKSLTIWSKEMYRQLKVDEFYVLTNLRSKMYDGYLTLNTTSSTTVTCATPLPTVVNIEREVVNKSSVLADLENVQVKKTHICKKCSKSVQEVNFADPTFLCPSCLYKQNTTSISVDIQISTNMVEMSRS